MQTLEETIKRVLQKFLLENKSPVHITKKVDNTRLKLSNQPMIQNQKGKKKREQNLETVYLSITLGVQKLPTHLAILTEEKDTEATFTLTPAFADHEKELIKALPELTAV